MLIFVLHVQGSLLLLLLLGFMQLCTPDKLTSCSCSYVLMLIRVCL
jgi:hypothetical protein